MKTTIQLDDQLYKLAHQHAVAKGMTFNALVEEALQEKLLPKKRIMPATSKKRTVLKTVAGDGLLVGYELANNSALIGSMEQE